MSEPLLPFHLVLYISLPSSQLIHAQSPLLLLCQLSRNISWEWLPPLVAVLAWIAVISTVYSGVVYVGVARQLLRKP